MTGLLFLFLPLLATAQVTKADYQRADTVMNHASLVYNTAVRPHWIGESHNFWYKNQEPQGEVYYQVNAETGEKVRIDKPADEPKKEKEEKQDKAISPDKKWKAYIKDNNLYICGLPDEKEPITLTMDGTKDWYYTDDVQWSPDSKKIATLRTRGVTERRIPLIESSPESQLQPILQWRDYAKPGDVIPVSVPVLFDVEARKQIPLNTQLYENQFNLYLTGWRKDSRAFTFEFNQRGHQRYIVGEVNAATGGITHKADEQSSTFIYYYRLFRHDLEDGNKMVWISERDGWRHLYLLNAQGAVERQLTKGNWVVREVDKVDEANGVIYFTASGLYKGEDPYNLHYCSVRLDGSRFKDYTPENGNHEVTFSKDRSCFVDVYSRPDLPAVSLLKRTSDAKVIVELQRCDVARLQETGWTMPEVFTAKGRDGKTDIWGTILRPSHFDTSKSYPVVEMIYAGPHDSHVGKSFQPYYHLCSKLSELGFIVVMIDGMGTANRSKAFHDVCWKNLKDAGFPDRIAWIKAAAKKYPYMDANRVGIYGWSAGGQNAMAALLFHNDFYKAAVSLCGCHDNRMDKIWWNEQWMGYPIDKSYSESSNVDNASLLKGKLLLINGELDDNVDPASTLQVVNALIKANKNFEQLYLPGKGHSLGGKYEMHRIHDFFVKSLLNQDPPEWE